MVYERHTKFLKRCATVLPPQVQSQDATRVVLAFFSLSGLDLLGALDVMGDKNTIIEWIYSLQVPTSNRHVFQVDSVSW